MTMHDDDDYGNDYGSDGNYDDFLVTTTQDQLKN